MSKVVLGLCTWVATSVCRLKHAYTSTFLRTQLGFQKHKKDKFSTIMVVVWNDSHIVWEPFQTPFFNYKKPYMVDFQNTEIPWEKPKIH